MRRKQLFLRWELLNMLTVLLFVGLGWIFIRNIHGAPLVITVVILLVTVAASVYGGVLSWNADKALESKSPEKMEKIIHDAKHLGLCFYSCQVLAALGAMFGVYLTASVSPDNAASAAADITSAMANGLLATMTGVICSLFLQVLHHFIVHKIERQ